MKPVVTKANEAYTLQTPKAREVELALYEDLKFGGEDEAIYEVAT